MAQIDTPGLSSRQAQRLQQQYGKNELTEEKHINFFKKALHVISEPMFLLLLAAAVIYFILGEPRDGAVMLIFVVGIISIDVIQEWKTDKTLSALKDLSAPHITVIRDGKEKDIVSTDLVPGDVMMIHEGVKIPADGIIIRCSDLCVDESSLTGESEGVWKTANAESGGGYWRKDYCYAGTLVTQGSAVVRVDKIGLRTEYGKIGRQVMDAKDEKTPLKKQTDSLVRLCAGVAAILFVLVGVTTFFNNSALETGDRAVQSILSGITLAMAMIPEEFPVILAVFLSMGAWRLAKKDSLVRKVPAVETLGAVSVLCVDKTGTITMNRMAVSDIWAPDGDSERLVETMGLACETDTYDPMEKAMLEHCEQSGVTQEHLFGGHLLTEYAFTNELKMMGHVWRHDGEFLIAAKGSPESINPLCGLSKCEARDVESKIADMSHKGLRVISVAIMKLKNDKQIPKQITDCRFEFCGLVGLADPPRKSVKRDIVVCSRAGIRVVMITGDNGVTAASIAKQVGIPGSDGNIITGDMIEYMSDDELRERIKTVSIFSRVIPEHKMRIVQAFKANGEVVAMTGDGVNDAPALKHADIGIAMGKRGSEVSREAADLILLDDNFSTIVETVKDGRRIYENIRKAVGYIFAIHIPIALVSLLSPLFGIPGENLMLLPLHIVLLELVIDPTCSIALERQPAEPDIMDKKPRDPGESLVGAGTLIKSVAQGLAIFAASFGTYCYALTRYPENAPLARAMGLAVIFIANIFLVQVNSSDTQYAYKTFTALIKDKVMWFINAATVAGLLLILYTPLGAFLKLAPLSLAQFAAVAAIGAASVLWYEIVKLIQRIKNK